MHILMFFSILFTFNWYCHDLVISLCFFCSFLLDIHMNIYMTAAVKIGRALSRIGMKIDGDWLIIELWANIDPARISDNEL